MPYLNKVEVMGNLGKDPELRYLPNGKATTTLSIAYTEKWRDREKNDLRERIEWFTAVLYDKQAETVCKYMKRGTVFLSSANSSPVFIKTGSKLNGQRMKSSLPRCRLSIHASRRSPPRPDCPIICEVV